MRDRGKRELEEYNNVDFFGENFIEFPCKKHPTSSSSSGGICAYCLTDRLAQLVCPQCGEQRLPLCSCSEIFSSNPNSSTTDVGRISFLLENEKGAEISASKPKTEQRSSNNNDDLNTLRRSNSISVGDMNNSKKPETGKFWKIGKLFRKKRDKSNHIKNNNEENNECNGVSRSRSLCSFRGFYDPEENGAFPVSSSAARASSVSTGNFVVDSAKQSCFSESDARISNFDYCDTSSFMGPNKNIFSLKETEFVSCDDPAFIDLKLHDNMSSDSRVPDLASLRRSGLGLSTKEFGFRGNDHGFGHEMYNNGGGSCRISNVRDRERDLRKCRKSYKVWRWFR
ncbi:hypothetical protein BVRB_6g140610 [Beta vulgaris subsp. vulgaris]|nr:hypothetical protein BVRB_6g140610 [Beta vulgaris subsp. vulgaris]